MFKLYIIFLLKFQSTKILQKILETIIFVSYLTPIRYITITTSYMARCSLAPTPNVIIITIIGTNEFHFHVRQSQNIVAL